MVRGEANFGMAFRLRGQPVADTLRSAGGVDYAHDDADGLLAASRIHDLERLARLSQQARRVAHDFRNLLLVADTRAEIAQMDSVGNDNAQQSLSAIRAVLSEAREMTSLLDGLARDLPLDGVPTNLSDVVRSATNTLRPALPEDIQLIEDIRLDPPVWIRGDSVQLSRLIRNLVLNARDAMPSGGKLAVALDVTSNGKVWLEIADSGAGMSEEARRNAFEPFFTTKSDRGGTGLGLPIVREIADAHGATIELDSVPGEGTRFRFTFPALDPGAIASARHHVTSAMVLVVGADDALRTAAYEMRDSGNYAVGFADSGWQALRVLEREPRAVQCLVLATGSLPSEDVALLRALRCWRGRRGVVLLVPEESTMGSLVTSRGECVLSYPYSPAEFLRSIELGMHAAN